MTHEIQKRIPIGSVWRFDKGDSFGKYRMVVRHAKHLVWCYYWSNGRWSMDDVITEPLELFESASRIEAMP